ncbi:ATP-binding protein [Candidatus Micrarchaeota archaeon]|nr:ATP-binding protein [Candidatus Micrarchaeota archaeon]
MSKEFETTKDILIPVDPLQRIIGQDQAVNVARILSRQKRHLLLVGPPGTGKSLIAQAISTVIQKPKQEISILQNQLNPERPLVEIRSEQQVMSDFVKNIQLGKIVSAAQVPTFVGEKLGFRCKRCGGLSSSSVSLCPHCGSEKFAPYTDKILDPYSSQLETPYSGAFRVYTNRIKPDGKEEQIIYERTPDGKVNILSQSDLRKIESLNKKTPRKVLIQLNRSTFVQATAASETELLGDVKHDPYGGHPQIGTPAYLRILPGAVHEAHEGVLFIDELATLVHLQKFILTAMQDKIFPIIGRNPTSSGASVRVDAVPCDFILVGAANITDLQHIIPPLRSRIKGDGYEILLNHFMPDSPDNRRKIAQFVAQEIIRDGRIPHVTFDSVEELINEAKNIAKTIDDINGLTLRLRNLSGIIKLAGDLAVLEQSEFIELKHVKDAVKNAKSIEEQVHEKYDNWWKAGSADHGFKSTKAGPETA